MHLKFRNVNTAFRGLVTRIVRNEIPTIEQDSRNGPVIRIPEPVIITYEAPIERVLFSPARDCNPFFHLYESFWMLAGRNDVEPLAYYNSNISNYSDDGKTFHGAYGYRWRKYFGYDQLDWIQTGLEADPGSRREVLMMWNAMDGEANLSSGIPACDLYVGGHGGKDVPCNVYAKFEILNGHLEMSVHNRSNDLIWGALGANVVHFSFLQEYLAGQLGVAIGSYHQITDNLHIYKERWEPDRYLEEEKSDWYSSSPASKPYGMYDYGAGRNEIDLDIQRVSKNGYDFANYPDRLETEYRTSFMRDVVQPALNAFHWHKQRDYNAALSSAYNIAAFDWREACLTWLFRRKQRWELRSL